MMVYNMISPILDIHCNSTTSWEVFFSDKYSDGCFVSMYQLHLIVSGELLGAVTLIVGGDKTVNMSTTPVGWLILIPTCENCPR